MFPAVAAWPPKILRNNRLGAELTKLGKTQADYIGVTVAQQYKPQYCRY